jgi:hypothetical protein
MNVKFILLRLKLIGLPCSTSLKYTLFLKVSSVIIMFDTSPESTAISFYTFGVLPSLSRHALRLYDVCHHTVILESSSYIVHFYVYHRTNTLIT